MCVFKTFSHPRFHCYGKTGRHGLLSTNLAAMSVFVVVICFFAGVVRLYYHVALNQPLHQHLCYIWISMDVVFEVISFFFKEVYV